MTTRVVITGMGVISPVGTGLDEFWGSLVAGKSGIRRISRFDASEFPSQLAAEVDFDVYAHIDRRDARKMDRFTQLAVVASRMALRDSNLGGFTPERGGVLMGTGIGGMETLAWGFDVLASKGPGKVSPFFIPMMIANIAAGQVAIDLGLKGPINTVMTACASGTSAIGEAFAVIRRGDADVMVCGGTEASIHPMALAGFCSMKALSFQNDMGSRACRPFDRLRDGFIMGEGAGILVLESLEHALSRKSRIYGEVLGFGMSADAHHITAPSPGGEGAARAIKEALRVSGLTEKDVDYVNAHGTSTPANDVTETSALKAVFGDRAYEIPVSSTKSMIGHLLGAAGAVETIATVLTMNHGVIPPTINYEEPDPKCDLDYVPNKARAVDVTVALKNSFGFGGQNACLVVRKYPG